MNVTVVDPLADLNEVRKFYNIDCLTQIPPFFLGRGSFDGCS